MNTIFKLIAFCLLIQFCYCGYIDGLNIRGNNIYNSAGQIVKLRGTTKSGSEYACVQGWGVFDGPVTSQLVSVMKTWNINIVRIPLNEDCWLGINGVKSEYGGVNYQNAIRGWVDTLYQQGIASILDLHWAAPGSQLATSQLPMPNTDHSLTFWTQVANAYKGNSHVIFEAFNEPYPDNNAWNSSTAWNCWRDGGNCPGANYNVAGMQSIVNAIRSTGAPNIIILGGIQYSNSLVEWLQFKPKDPLNQLGAVWHSYNFNYCNNQNCWNSYVRPVAQSVPVIATEIGENDCADGYINPLMNFLDSVGAHYLAWAFNPFTCTSFPALITSYDGTPSGYGIGYKAHLVNLANSTNTIN